MAPVDAFVHCENHVRLPEDITMKLRSRMSINGKTYAKGTEVPWYKVYPFFLIHMLMFGGSGFVMAYAGKDPPVLFLYLHRSG